MGGGKGEVERGGGGVRVSVGGPTFTLASLVQWTTMLAGWLAGWLAVWWVYRCGFGRRRDGEVEVGV